MRGRTSPEVKAAVIAFLKQGWSVRQVKNVLPDVPDSRLYYWKAHLPAMEDKLNTLKSELKETENVNKLEGSAPEKRPQEIPSDLQAYALGHVSCWLGVFAAQHNLPVRAFTERVAELLKAS